MESFISIDPNSLSTSDLHKMLLLPPMFVRNAQCGGPNIESFTI